MGCEATVDGRTMGTLGNPWLAQFLEDLIDVCQDSDAVAREVLPVRWYGVFSSRAFWKYDT